MKEIWRDINKTVIDYTGLYQISNLGRVKSLKRQTSSTTSRICVRTIQERILRQNFAKYKFVVLAKNSVNKNYTVHRLVALHFCDNPNNKPEVNHKDCDKYNNHFTNLEWVTRGENEMHSFRVGFKKVKCGEQCHFSKLTEEQVKYIKNNKNIKPMQLVRELNISLETIRRIRLNQQWRHIL